jgi:FkbM family methyltransferase
MTEDKLKFFHNLRLNGYFFFLRLKCLTLGLRFVRPNYAFFEKQLGNGIAIDVGVGDNPDFTIFLINKYNIETFVVDPTFKHMAKLRAFAAEHQLVHYLPLALGSKNEIKTFYESVTNVSGSLRKDHHNVQNDPLNTYNIQVVTLSRLLQECGDKPVDIMKIDIEGEEYDLIKSLSEADLRKIKQLIIEFHHDIVKEYTMANTLQAIKIIEGSGMKSILYNGRDCLFYRSDN